MVEIAASFVETGGDDALLLVFLVFLGLVVDP